MSDIDAVAERYAVAITPLIQELIDADNCDGPIARQLMPDTRELETDEHDLDDPIGDGAHAPVSGIVHRYPDRVLLTPTKVCSVYCRFCLRREVVGPGEDAILTAAQQHAALAYSREHDGIWEVILSGVNDDAGVFEALLRRMVENRIKPYYLHHADRANATRHFRTTIDHGRSLVASLRGPVSGICQPSYVLDIPGGHGKSPLGPDYVGSGGDGRIAVMDYQGNWHEYES